MLKQGEDKKSNVNDLLDLLARGQDLLERAQQTLVHAERVHAEVSAKPPPAPPPAPAPYSADEFTFPWPPPPDDLERGLGGDECRA